MSFDPTQPCIVTKTFTIVNSSGPSGGVGTFSYKAGEIISDPYILTLLNAQNAPIASVFLALPTPTANGTPLSAVGVGIEFRVPPGGSITYTVASLTPTSPPSQTTTISNPSNASGNLVDQVMFPSGLQVYVTAATGSSIYRML